MPDLLIETRALRKSYLTRHGRRHAVDGLDLRVPEGGVHGFLGPNGSGKTTTIRMVLGLARPDSGEVRLFGELIPQHLPAVIDNVGAVVESPKLFGGFTGRVNLMLLARSVGLPKARVDEVLESVGMSERADDRYHAYSLGMKQRLAIAGALLKKPKLLILDEPTNGLDPAGIRQIRDLVRNLATDGTTVLISSHILAEVQQVCDSVSIIGRGRSLAGGPVAEVLAHVAGGSARTFQITVADGVGAANALTAAGLSVQPGHDALLVSGASDPADITRILAQQGHYLSSLSPVGGDLETAFLKITEGQGLR